jgi:hypothetical protein
MKLVQNVQTIPKHAQSSGQMQREGMKASARTFHAFTKDTKATLVHMLLQTHHAQGHKFPVTPSQQEQQLISESNPDLLSLYRRLLLNESGNGFLTHSIRQMHRAIQAVEPEMQQSMLKLKGSQDALRRLDFPINAQALLERLNSPADVFARSYLELIKHLAEVPKAFTLKRVNLKLDPNTPPEYVTGGKYAIKQGTMGHASIEMTPKPYRKSLEQFLENPEKFEGTLFGYVPAHLKRITKDYKLISQAQSKEGS